MSALHTPLQAGLAFLPMTIVNFGVAIAVPKLTHRYGQRPPARRRPRHHADRDVLAQPTLRQHRLPDRHRAPHGAHRSRPRPHPQPPHRRRDHRLHPEDAGAASGLVNVAHRLGGSIGLGILVTVFAAADATGLSADGLLAHRVSTALTVGSGMLAGALVIVAVLIARPLARPTTNVQTPAGAGAK
jgi:hypothetical protein